MTRVERHVSDLEGEVFDLLVIGGGVGGLGVAWDAALRGLKVALIEKGDFGSGTSAGCFKIVHGGVRYLQRLNLSKLRESVREQRTLRFIAPHLVHPLPFLIPCYGGGKKSKGLLRLGLSLYELLAFDRNLRLPQSHRLENHRVISKERCLELAPGIHEGGLLGGVVYYDCQMSNCDRLTFALAKSAIAASATLCNYVQALEFSFENSSGQCKRISSVVARDITTGKRLQISAKVVVSAIGPWSAGLQSFFARNQDELGASQSTALWSKGIQLILPPLTKDVALAFESRSSEREHVLQRGNRSYFIAPWRGCSLVGTSDTLVESNGEGFSISREEIEKFVADLRLGYNSNLFSLDSVKFAFGGLRPVKTGLTKGEMSEGEATATLEDSVVDHEEQFGLVPSTANLLSVVGAKYTTFRSTAETVVDQVFSKLELRQPSCRTGESKLVGAENLDDFEKFVQGQISSGHLGLSSRTIRHLACNYGSELKAICELIEFTPSLQQPLGSPYRLYKGRASFCREK